MFDIWQDGGEIVVKLKRFDQELVNCIKSLPFRKYNPETKTWHIPLFLGEELQKKINGLGYGMKIAEEIARNRYEHPIDITGLLRKPYQHQLEGARFLLNTKKCILADEMGCGKTLTSIIAASQVDGKKLVICPASLKANWVKEIKSTYNTSVNVVRNGVDPDCEWNVINYDIVEKFEEDLMKLKPAVLILDEAHYIKSVTNSGRPGSNRAKVVMEIAEHIPYKFLLTGTPITSRVKDIYNLLKVIDHPLGRMRFFEFGLRYCAGYQDKFGWHFDGASNVKELSRYIKDYYLRRTKDEIIELPDKIRQFLPVEVDLSEYNDRVQEYYSKVRSPHEQLVQINIIKHALADAKAKVTCELAEDIVNNEGSVVIFTNYRSVIETLKNRFGYDCVVVDGQTDTETRQKNIENFQAGRVPVFVGNMAAAGVGITLTRARTAIINDFDWVPATHIQAEDRIHRIGQHNKTTIYYLYAEGADMDEHLAATLEKKIAIIEDLLDGESRRKTGNTSMLDDIREFMNRHTRANEIKQRLQQVRHTTERQLGL